MSTPLVAHVQSDRLIWKVEKNGKYYVKSVYRLYVKELIDSANLRSPKNWSDNWKLKVSPKGRNLVRGICQDC